MKRKSSNLPKAINAILKGVPPTVELLTRLPVEFKVYSKSPKTIKPYYDQLPLKRRKDYISRNTGTRAKRFNPISVSFPPSCDEPRIPRSQIISNFTNQEVQLDSMEF